MSPQGKSRSKPTIFNNTTKNDQTHSTPQTSSVPIIPPHLRNAQRPSSSQGGEGLIHIEDYNEEVDSIFIRDYLKPYLTDLYADLQMRSSHENSIDKVTFIEYTKLPGIINDRLHIMFSDEGTRASSSSPENKNKSVVHQKKDENVTSSAFFNNFKTIFIGNLDEKIKFTFKMYDFDNDGFITPEDIRILMSYMPFDHNVQLQDVENII